MKIVVLDIETAVLNHDISLDRLGEFGELRIAGETDPQHIAEVIGDAQAVICNKSCMTREVIAHCPHLAYIGLMGTGFDQVDMAAAREYGITVCNVPSYSTDAVAQHTMALILNYCCRLSDYAVDCAAGGWTDKRYYACFGRPTFELAGKTIGLIGCGDIGRKVAALCAAFGMKVLAYTRSPQKLEDVSFVTCVGLEELLRRADIVSLHTPLNDGTRELINARTLRMMKPTALLVNTARGGIINESDLAQALHEGVIAAAAIDVLTQEPMTKDTPLSHAENLTMTPHIAWAPIETRRRLFEVIYQNLKCYVQGKPQNMVS